MWKSPGESFDDSGCSFRRTTVSSGSRLHAVVGPLQNATAHEIRVVAVNGSGPGAPLDFSGTPVAIPGPPRAVGAFAVDGGLLVGWYAPWDGGSPITEYRVQWKGTGQEYNDSDRQATVTDFTNLSHEITGLTNGASYTVRVLAVNANGQNHIQERLESTGTPGDAPGRPRSLVTERMLSRRWGKVDCYLRVTWEAPTETGGSAITGYRIQWKRVWAETYAYSALVTLPGDLTYEVKIVHYDSICRDMKRHLRISAINSAGAGPPVEVPGL